MTLPDFDAESPAGGPDYVQELIDKANHTKRSQDARLASAAIAMHCTWVERSSPFGKGPHFYSETPLDTVLLDRAAASTFADWPPREGPHELPPGGSVINKTAAETQLEAVLDPVQAALAWNFARRIVGMSAESDGPQDLAYCVRLFLSMTGDKNTLANIVSGEIVRISARLADPGNW
jgi:hypothetical protein